MFLTPHGGNLVILVPKIRVVVLDFALDFALAFGVMVGCYRNGNLVWPLEIMGPRLCNHIHGIITVFLYSYIIQYKLLLKHA